MDYITTHNHINTELKINGFWQMVQGESVKLINLGHISQWRNQPCSSPLGINFTQLLPLE